MFPGGMRWCTRVYTLAAKSSLLVYTSEDRSNVQQFIHVLRHQWFLLPRTVYTRAGPRVFVIHNFSSCRQGEFGTTCYMVDFGCA